MVIKIDGFDVAEEIGRGGFGVVYRAVQRAFNRPVAVKVLHAGVPAVDLQRRFANECRAVGALRSHPNVLRVYSTGTTDDGSPYLAMELLTGGSLSERLPLPPDSAAALGIRLASGLQLAHASGVIHRDVKPSNVLFNDDDEPVLVDFGISSLVGEASTTTSNVAVSIGYAPPEVLDGKRPGVAADVYALGATLFAAVTGRAPFVSEAGFSSIAVIAARIATQPVEDLRPLGVPAALCDVIEKAMAKDPADRYGSMAEFAEALVPVADDATVRTARALWGLPAAAEMPTRPPAVEEADGVRADNTTRPRRRVLGAVRAHRLASIAAAVALLAGVALAVDLATSSSPPKKQAALISTPGTTGAPAPGSTKAASVAGDSGHLSAPSSNPGKSKRPHHQPGQNPGKTVRSTTPGELVPPAVAQGGGGVPPTTASHSSSHAPAPVNHAPTVTFADRSSNEGAGGATVTASDPDGNRVTFRVASGRLPPGLSMSSRGVISGTISADAVSGRTSYTASAPSRTFTFSVIATDTRNASSRARTVHWTVFDTMLPMPDYVGYFGDGTDPGFRPDIGKTFGTRHFDCVYQPSAASGSVWRQSINPGTPISWGGAIHIWWAEPYHSDPGSGTPCVSVSRGYGP